MQLLVVLFPLGIKEMDVGKFYLVMSERRIGPKYLTNHLLASGIYALKTTGVMDLHLVDFGYCADDIILA